MNIETVMNQWELLAPVMMPPQDQLEYDTLVANLDAVLDAGGANEGHPLASLADYLGELIADFEDHHIEQLTPITGKQLFKFLMKEHGLKQSDFSEVGSQGVISELQDDTKNRQLTVAHIKLLAKRFGVSPNSFI